MLSVEWFGSNKTNLTSACVIDGPFANWVSTDGTCIRRTFLPIYGYIGEAQLMAMIANAPVYGYDANGFRSKYEGAPHAAPHNYLGAGGGHMGTMLSTNDPFFYLHHSNVDRIFALWQDCHNYDKLSPNYTVPLSAYEGTEKGLDGTLDIMPYDWERIEAPHPYFTKKVTPQDVMWINGETSLMKYTYEPGDRLRGLLDYTYGECKWDWFAEDFLYNEKRDLQEEQEQEEEEYAEEIESNEEADILEVGRKMMSVSGNDRTKEIAEAQVLGAVRKIMKPQKHNSNKPIDPIKEKPARASILNAMRHIRDKSTDYKERAGYSDSARFQFRDPFYDKQTGEKRYKFHDPAVQKLYEQIIKENPYPQVPKRHQLQMLAIAECQLYGGKAHSSEEWIAIQRMESQSEVFAPICKYRYG